jgi:hypothetical protein
LDNLTTLGGTLWILDNDTLSDCAVLSICNYLLGTGVTWIENNAVGCNSPQEVLSACGVGSDENTIPENNFYIYPNPSSSLITIETSGIGSLIITNLNGQFLMEYQITEPITQIDITAFPSGIYFIKLKNNKTVEVKKIVKE